MISSLDIASVEFLSREEWTRELEVLFNDMRGEDGVMVKRPDPRSGGGIALTKIRVSNRKRSEKREGGRGRGDEKLI